MSVTISASRNAVCKKVPTGNKIIHAAVSYPETVEEEYEWKCDETILGAEYYGDPSEVRGMNYQIRIVHDPLEGTARQYAAYAYRGPVDPEAPFLPGADFSGRGETQAAAIAALRQNMRRFKDKQPDEWIKGTLTYDDGEQIVVRP